MTKQKNMHQINSILLILFLLVINFSCFNGNAQKVEEPNWTFTTSQNEVKVGDEIELIFKAQITPKFYMYSSDFKCNGGPNPAQITFDKKGYELVGSLKPVNSKKEKG